MNVSKTHIPASASATFERTRRAGRNAGDCFNVVLSRLTQMCSASRIAGHKPHNCWPGCKWRGPDLDPESPKKDASTSPISTGASTICGSAQGARNANAQRGMAVQFNSCFSIRMQCAEYKRTAGPLYHRMDGFAMQRMTSHIAAYHSKQTHADSTTGHP